MHNDGQHPADGTGEGAEDLRELVAQLRQALATQPVIEQAKGVLMLARACTADEAFAALREVSQRTNVKLHDVAAALVTLTRPAPPHDPSAVLRAVAAAVRAAPARPRPRR
ncbi:ANTAR domain-containing protein [Actinosynnema sp. NPDC023587]|uniref:ANTAR domain-containing protein n=1 Tax=Actinosynnema sp. NPDC023587 TaxID=3154695 RepID=UPI0033D390EF